MINDIIQGFDKQLKPTEAKMLNPLVLAYIGDSIYEIYVRKYIVLNNNYNVNIINRECIKYVKATSQSIIINKLLLELTDEEISIFKRGRNTKSQTVPKNAKINDYRHATGFETLLGFLYITGNTDRLKYLIASGINYMDSL